MGTDTAILGLPEAVNFELSFGVSSRFKKSWSYKAQLKFIFLCVKEILSQFATLFPLCQRYRIFCHQIY